MFTLVFHHIFHYGEGGSGDLIFLKNILRDFYKPDRNFYGHFTTPLPLTDASAQNASFFYVLPNVKSIWD